MSLWQRLFGGEKPPAGYYLVENFVRNVTEFAVFVERVPKGLTRSYDWALGKPLPVKLPEPVRYDQEDPGPLEDYLRTHTTQFLVSRRFFALVQAASTCARGYAAEIYRQGKLVSADYVAVNFEMAWPCMDRARSKLQMSELGYVMRVTRLVLRPDAIPPSEELFRLAEFPIFLLATDTFRRRAEEEGITGVQWLDFRGRYLV